MKIITLENKNYLTCYDKKLHPLFYYWSIHEAFFQRFVWIPGYNTCWIQLVNYFIYNLMFVVYLVFCVQLEMELSVSCSAYRTLTCGRVLPCRLWSAGLCPPAGSCSSSASMTRARRPRWEQTSSSRRKNWTSITG